MTLFHGTTKEFAESIFTNGIDLTQSHKRTDFGRGFYTTPSLESATRWAERKSILEKAAIVYFYFDEKKAESLIRKFDNADLEWVQFIVNNRCDTEYMNAIHCFDHNQDGKYDIVQGKICDGRVTEIARRIAKEQRVVNSNDLKALVKSDYPEQYSFHTSMAFGFLKPIKVVNL